MKGGRILCVVARFFLLLIMSSLKLLLIYRKIIALRWTIKPQTSCKTVFKAARFQITDISLPKKLNLPTKSVVFFQLSTWRPFLLCDWKVARQFHCSHISFESVVTCLVSKVLFQCCGDSTVWSEKFVR